MWTDSMALAGEKAEKRAITKESEMRASQIKFGGI
jgi:hypothetical protein